MQMGKGKFKDMYLGVDMGGTTVKIGLVTEDGQLFATTTIPTVEYTTESDCAKLAWDLSTFARENLADTLGVYKIAGVGIAIPGVVSKRNPDLLPNIRLNFEMLHNAMSYEFPETNVVYINDANAAGLGELWQGSAVGAESLLYITLGTGIGGALISHGHIITGFNGAAGEIGHLNVLPDGRECGCGGHGCLEQYASAKGVVKSYFEFKAEAGDTSEYEHDPKHPSDSLSVFEAYADGNEYAIRAIQTFSEMLGLALSQAACIFDPHMILLGGGMAGSADVFLPMVVSSYKEHSIKPVRNTEIRKSALGNKSGMIGAAYYALSKNSTWE